METLSLVLWLCLYPVCTMIETYYSVMRKEKLEHQQANENSFRVYFTFCGLIYYSFAIYLLIRIINN